MSRSRASTRWRGASSWRCCRAAVRESGATAVLSSHIVTDIEQVCDRLIVLGVGHVLLDDSITGAVRRHAIHINGDGVIAGPGLVMVGAFLDDAGRTLTLVRIADGRQLPPGGLPRDLRPPTVDEVVKGYLVAGRRLQRDIGAA